MAGGIRSAVGLIGIMVTLFAEAFAASNPNRKIVIDMRTGRAWYNFDGNEFELAQNVLQKRTLEKIEKGQIKDSSDIARLFGLPLSQRYETDMAIQKAFSRGFEGGQNRVNSRRQLYEQQGGDQYANQRGGNEYGGAGGQQFGGSGGNFSPPTSNFQAPAPLSGGGGRGGIGGDAYGGADAGAGGEYGGGAAGGGQFTPPTSNFQAPAPLSGPSGGRGGAGGDSYGADGGGGGEYAGGATGGGGGQFTPPTSNFQAPAPLSGPSGGRGGPGGGDSYGADGGGGGEYGGGGGGAGGNFSPPTSNFQAPAPLSGPSGPNGAGGGDYGNAAVSNEYEQQSSSGSTGSYNGASSGNGNAFQAPGTAPQFRMPASDFQPPAPLSGGGGQSFSSSSSSSSNYEQSSSSSSSYSQTQQNGNAGAYQKQTSTNFDIFSGVDMSGRGGGPPTTNSQAPKLKPIEEPKKERTIPIKLVESSSSSQSTSGASGSSTSQQQQQGHNVINHEIKRLDIQQQPQ